jgi:NADH-quinone oxidoreductase subunit J
MIPLLILSPLILLAALGAVWMARPVHAALLLALSLALNAVLYLVMGADFIGLVQFMVYVGAVAVLIVFSLLITRPGDEAEELRRRPGALLPGVACTLPVLAMVLFTVSKTAILETGNAPSISMESLGKTLFTSHAPAVLALAVLLTAVMIGAALLARGAHASGLPRSASCETKTADETGSEPPIS